MGNIMQQRRDIEAEWASANPILADGQIGYVTDTVPWKQKIGNGITRWNDMGYYEGYIHPLTHPPSIISQDLNNRFVTDFEKTRWNSQINSVKNYGAIGDNIADDTSAIQAALNAGGAIYFPDGIYRVTSTLNISVNSTTLVGGQSWSQSTMIYKTNAGDMFNVTANYFASFVGIALKHGGTSGKIMNFQNGLGHKVVECYFENLTSNSSDIIEINSSNTFIEDCYMTNTNASAYCVHVRRTTAGILINSGVRRTYMGGIGQGVKVASSVVGARAEGIWLLDSTLITTGSYQVNVQDVLFINISNNMLDQCGSSCIYLNGGITGVQQAVINGNYIAAATGGSTGVGIYAGSTPTAINDIVISNNKIGYSGYGINLGSWVDNVTEDNNSFTNITNCDCLYNQTKNVSITNGKHINSNICLALTDGASGGPFVISNNKLVGTLSVTGTDRLNKFKWSNNTGLKTDGYAVGNVAVSSDGQKSGTISHGCVSTPSIWKCTVTARTNSGMFDVIPNQILAVDATNITIKFGVYFLSVAGDVQFSCKVEI